MTNKKKETNNKGTCDPLFESYLISIDPNPILLKYVGKEFPTSKN